MAKCHLLRSPFVRPERTFRLRSGEAQALAGKRATREPWCSGAEFVTRRKVFDSGARRLAAAWPNVSCSGAHSSGRNALFDSGATRKQRTHGPSCSGAGNVTRRKVFDSGAAKRPTWVTQPARPLAQPRAASRFVGLPVCGIGLCWRSCRRPRRALRRRSARCPVRLPGCAGSRSR